MKQETKVLCINIVLKFFEKCKVLVCFLLFFSLSLFAGLEEIHKVVIWGHKLHTHTHSYIHNSFFKAFEHLGYDTYWFDDMDDVTGFDFANTLFLTEGQVDIKIPLRTDCFYILHNTSSKYKELIDSRRAIMLQVYTDDVLKRDTLEISKCIHFDLKNKMVYMPWATDLLPEEINVIKSQMPIDLWNDKIYWIGTIGSGQFGNINEINAFKKACSENNIQFIGAGGLSFESNRNLISHSYMAPAIVGAWQSQVNYIPCRIFKNISYGQMGITNSYRVYELFNKKIVYNPDTYQLFYDAKKALKKMKIEQLFELMDFVRDNHTYINRINTLLNCLDAIVSQSN